LTAFFQNEEIEGEHVNGYFVLLFEAKIVRNTWFGEENIFYLSCIILKCASEERLREEETRYPETRRSSIVNPFVHLF